MPASTPWPTSASTSSPICNRCPLSFYADRRTGELVSRITNDVSLLQQAITANLVMLLRQIITIVGAAALLLLDWRLTLIILLVVPVITPDGWCGWAAAYGWPQWPCRIAGRSRQLGRGNHPRGTHRQIVCPRIAEISRFTNRVMTLYEAAMHRARIHALLSPLIGLIASITVTGILYYGGYR